MAAHQASVPGSLRFGPFALDLRSGDLSKNGRPIRLQEKPRSLLLALAERPGELMTRTELHQRLWPNDTFVDFEDGLNAAMSKLREVLGDDPQSPRFIETVRGRGYRLLAPVEHGTPALAAPVAHAPAPAQAASAPAASAPAAPAPLAPARLAPARPGPAAAAASTRGRSRSRAWLVLLSVVLAAGAAGLWFWLTHGRPVLSFAAQDVVLIADFDNQTGDPRLDNALGTALEVSLAQSRHFNVYSHLQAATVLRLMARPEESRINAGTAREICLRESIPALVAPGITRTGAEYLVTAELIDPSTGSTVRSYSEPAHGEDRILAALDALATAIRRDLGESRYEIHRDHQPLPEVTTKSLAALQNYAQGAALFGRARADDAVRMYQQALKLDPDFAMAHAALGYAYYSFYLNEPSLGEQEFQRALALSARTTERERSWIELRYAESQGRIDDALRLYRDYLGQYPGDWLARYSYARLLRMNGHTQESLPIYEQLARQQADDPGVYIELATAHAALTQWAQAVTAYEKAFGLDPHMLAIGETNRSYGFTLVENGQEAKAVKVFTAQLADPGTYVEGERSLAALDLYHGQYASGRQRYLLALAHSQSPFSIARIRYMLAAIASGQGNPREAVGQLDLITAHLDALPRNLLYGALVGQAYARAGAVDKARKVLADIEPDVNDRNPQQVAFAGLLKAEVAAASGNPQAALQFLKPPAPGDDVDTTILVQEALAHVYQQMGNLDQAIYWYRQLLQGGDWPIVAWEPESHLFEAYYNLAADEWRRGDRAGAMSTVSILLTHWQNADPNLPLLREARQLQNELTDGH